MMLRHSFSAASYDYGEEEEDDDDEQSKTKNHALPPPASAATTSVGGAGLRASDLEKGPMIGTSNSDGGGGGGGAGKDSLVVGSETTIVPQFFAERFDAHIEQFLTANLVTR